MLVSYAATFVAGLLTFASPCILPLVPLYLSVLAGSAAGNQDEARRASQLRRAGVGFALGLGVVFVALGMTASALARSLADYRAPLLIASGLLMVLFGLKLLGVLRLPGADREARPLMDRLPSLGGLPGGLLFGGAFAIGWTPCVGPVLGAVLTYTATQSASAWTGGAYLAAYALGLALPLVAAAFAAPKVLPLLDRLKAHMATAQRVVGAAMVLLGALTMGDKLGWLVPSFGEADVITASAAAAGSPSDAPAPACQGEECSCGEAGCAVEQGAGPVDGAKLTGSPRLVEFVSGGCSVCAKMAPVVRDVNTRCAMHDQTIQTINVDDPNNKALAARYGVRVVPTFLSVDAQGEEVARMVGEQSAGRLMRALEETQGARCTASL